PDALLDAADRLELDAIVNLTPLPVHAEVTRAALRRELHVYSEKPLAPTFEEAKDLRNLAMSRMLVLVAAPSILLFPQIVRARELLPTIGSVRSARAFVAGGIPPWEGYASDPSPYFAADAGPLVDLGVYPFHVLTGLLGEATQVLAASTRTRERFTVADGPFAGLDVPVEADDTWFALLRLGDGAIASVGANFSTQGIPGPECEVFGERGTLAFSLLDVAAPIVRSGSDGWVDEPVASARPGGGPDHILGVRHLAECIRGGFEPVVSADHALHVLRVIEAARASARDGRATAVDPVD
ncbi:MAG: Gfo/Idh/MocA family protein, partial [Actinomycetota bacterium]